MKNNLIGIAALCIFPTVAVAAEKPDWAFPVTEKVQPPPRFEGARVRPAPPGSTLSITRAKADDMYDIPKHANRTASAQTVLCFTRYCLAAAGTIAFICSPLLRLTATYFAIRL